MILAFSCDCTGRFESDLIGNQEYPYSCVAAHVIYNTDDMLLKTNEILSHYNDKNLHYKLSVSVGFVFKFVT